RMGCQMILACAAARVWQLGRFAVVLIVVASATTTGSYSHAQVPGELVDIQQIESSIIKIYTTSAAPDYFTPWPLMNPSQSSGSGAVISGNRILTNTHVVANASYVQVQKHNDP